MQKNAGDTASFIFTDALLNKERAHAVFADAPYNVRINGHVGGNGKTKHREFEKHLVEYSIDFDGFVGIVI